MSVFHRIDDVTALDGPTFLRLAWRLPAYAGVMQNVVTRQQMEQDSSPAPQTDGPFSTPGRDINPGTRATLEADPVFAGLISFG